MKLALLVVMVAACGTDTSHAISSDPLAGVVNGQPWSFVAGSTDAFLSQNQDDFFAVFYPSTYPACGSEPGGPHLIVSVPKSTGSYDFSLSRNMTFAFDNNNDIATDGTVRVDTVTSTTLTGGLHGTFDNANEVDGVFTLTICAPMAAI